MIIHKRKMSLLIPIRNKNLNSEKLRKELIINELIKKIIKIKKENKFINCITFYDFIYNKFSLYLSLEDCFKLFYLQNKDFFFNKKLMRHICTTISNSSIHRLLVFKNEFILDHSYNCNILKYKCYFINEFYNLINNILLLCSLNLCTPYILKNICDQQKQIKLKNLHNFYNYNKNELLSNMDRKKNKIRDIHLFIKLYRCFSTNNIYPFPFLNQYAYYSFYISPFKKITRNIIYHKIFNGKNYFSFNLELYKNITHLKFHEISQILFYLSKNNLFFYFESFLNTYFYILVIYIFRMIHNYFNNVLTHLKEENNFIRTEEYIDSLMMSFINYLSSSYVVKNIRRKIPSVLLCIYISSTLFYLLNKYLCSCCKLTSLSKTTSKEVDFILLDQKEIYLNKLSFMKKCILLLYIIDDLIPNIQGEVLYKKDIYKKQLKKIGTEFQKNILQDNIKENNHKSQYYNESHAYKKETEDIQHINKIKNSEYFINKNIKLFLCELLSKTNRNIFCFLQLPFLKLLHYNVFIYPIHNKNEDSMNMKKSALEKNIFQLLQQYIKKKNSNYILSNSNSHIFFTVDIEVYKKK